LSYQHQLWLKRQLYSELYSLSDERLIHEVKLGLSITWFNKTYLSRVNDFLATNTNQLYKKNRDLLVKFLIADIRSRDKHLTELTDELLMQAAELIIKTPHSNPRFLKISQDILKSCPTSLSERQRGALLGLLTINYEHVRVLEYGERPSRV
jgi:hypothetical protein